MLDKIAPIGVALISKNASETLGVCLDSIRPYVEQIVVGVDETTTDNTYEIAQRHGADIVQSVKVSDWHECPYHGRVLAQHFAQAREQSFALLNQSLPYFMWLDSDDYVSSPELLKEVCDKLTGSNVIGVWSPYHYATLGGGKTTNTLFHRERILKHRTASGQVIPWKWEHRVHEVVAPVGNYNLPWIKLDTPAIYHQEHGHNTQASSKRNLLLLEIDLEENPNDARAIFYMGNQYFAMGDFAKAVQWYEQTGQVGKNPYELWQSWVYCSIAYERLNDLDNALKAAFAAIDINPKHPEPYYRLASIYLLAGDFEKVEFWTEQARMDRPLPPKEPPPFFVFKNPLDYNFNNQLPLADALAAQGKIRQARQVLEEAHSALADERVEKAIEHYKKLESSEEKAAAFYHLTEDRTDEQVIDLWDRLALPSDVRQFGRVRDRVMPAILRRRTGSPRAIFYCGRSLEEWSPASLETTGIGGSETAVVEIAKRFAKDGWRVDVYNGAGRYEGEYDNVGYWEPERLRRDDKTDLFVSWRQPQAVPAIKAERAVLWLHDLNYGPSAIQALKGWDSTKGSVVLAVSEWHRDYLARAYGLGRADFAPNGIDISRFNKEAKPRKEGFQCVYASSPDRGLERLLHIWRKVLKEEPGAKLKIAYGWENIDKAILAGNEQLAMMKGRIVKLVEETENVEWLGRIPQDKLADLYLESAVWAYPTHFLEVSCISAMEAMAGGAIPVTSRFGALAETIGEEAGFFVEGQPETYSYRDLYLQVLLGVLTSPQLRWPKQIKGVQRVSQLTWDDSYKKWSEIVERLEHSVKFSV